MELTGWTIDACGHLRDTTVSGIGPHVTVLLGPNEAGKSTTHQALRWLLLGFPSANTSVFRRYRPVGGGPVGGRLRVRHLGRPLVLERSSTGGGPARLFEPDGRPAEDVSVADLLGTTTPELYRSVFAVGLDELHEAGALDRDEVREHLFAAGVVGAGRSATAALRSLDGRRDQLLRPRSGLLRDIARELADARAAAASARDRAVHLGAARARADRCEAEAAVTWAEYDQARAEAALLDALVEFWPTWVQRCAAAREAADLPQADLGPGPLERLDRLVADREAAATAVRSLQEDADALARRLDGCRPDPALVGSTRRVLEALADQRADAGRSRDLDQARAQLARRVRAQERAVAELGPGWDPERVLATSWTAAVATQVDAVAARLRQAQDRHHAAELTTADVTAPSSDPDVERDPDAEASPDAQTLPTGRPRPVPAAVVAAACVAGAVAALVAGAPWWVAVALLAGATAGVAAAAAGVAPRAPTPAVPAAHRERTERELSQLAAVQLAERRLAAAREELEAARRDWDHVARTVGLPADVDPATAGALVRDVLALRATLHRSLDERSALEDARAGLAASAAARASLLAELGGEPVDPTDPAALVTALAELADRCEAADDAAGRRRDLQDRLADVDARLATARRELEHRRAELAAACTAVGVDDEDGYRRLAVLVERRQELVGRVQRADLELEQRFGSGDDAGRARKELAVGSVEDWNRAASATRDRAERLCERHGELHREAARERHGVEQVERSSEVAAADMEVDRLTHELADATKDWVRLTLARDAVAATLDRFERERQPEVVATASRSLSRVTGRWERIVTGDGRLEVLGPTGARLGDESLSRGTVEQLYLCMRLALARTHARRTARLPVLLDDVIVNADDERAAQLAVEVAEVAEDLQVLVFTARAATARSLVAARADTRVIELTPTITSGGSP